MREVAIIGVGMQKWGELWEKSLRDVYVEAALLAIEDAGVDHIDSMYVGAMSGGLFNEQEHLASLMADYLGVAGIPATRVESACSSGGLALRSGMIEVASGLSDIVLVGGVEKMCDVSGDEATYGLASASDADWEAFFGITFPGLYAMMANAYFEKYGITPKHLAEVAVKNHFHGSMNPNAQFPQKITTDTVLNSVMVADPLHIFDCSPITDGGAAVILCPLDQAKKYTKHPAVQIIGSGHSTDSIALHDRKDLTFLNATARAADQAYKMAGKTPKDIDTVEVHDCFTIAEVIVLESLGLFEKGMAAKATEAGETRFDAKQPVNTSGGLKSKGHPVGATGVAQAIEITEQLRGEAGERQVKNAKVGMTQNMGGSGGSTLVHIMEVK